MDLDSDTMERLNEKMELLARKNKFKRVLLPQARADYTDPGKSFPKSSKLWRLETKRD